MNPIIPLALIVGGFGATAFTFWLWEAKGVDPLNRWIGDVGRLGLIVGMFGVILAPSIIVWFLQ